MERFLVQAPPNRIPAIIERWMVGNPGKLGLISEQDNRSEQDFRQDFIQEFGTAVQNEITDESTDEV